MNLYWITFLLMVFATVISYILHELKHKQFTLKDALIHLGVLGASLLTLTFFFKYALIIFILALAILAGFYFYKKHKVKIDELQHHFLDKMKK